MAKNRENKVYDSEDCTDWYWVSGLHDACIVGVESFEFPFDNDKLIGQKDKNARNLLVLKINAKSAIYDTAVEEIRFYNYKVLTPEVSIDGRKKIWWLSDDLIKEDNRFVLEIDLQDLEPYPQDFTFKIQFEKAQVKRNKSR